MRVQSLEPHSARWGCGLAMSCGVGHRHGSDLALLWLRQRLAAVAPIRPLAWELPYAAGAALKSKTKKTTKKLDASHCYFYLLVCLLH